jgi:hypothetical protein
VSYRVYVTGLQSPMTGRTQAILYGPVAAVLPLHILLLVLAARRMPTSGPWQLGDPWTTWNMAAPVLVLFAFGYVTRKVRDAGDEDADAVARSLAKWTWGAVILDVIATALAFLLTHR